MNTISLIGRTTAHPELRSTSGGTAVCSFRLAVNTPGRIFGGLALGERRRLALAGTPCLLQQPLQLGDQAVSRRQRFA